MNAVAPMRPPTPTNAEGEMRLQRTPATGPASITQDQLRVMLGVMSPMNPPV
jgi:hypothetical protein